MQFPWSFWTVSQTPNLSGPGGYQNQGYQGGQNASYIVNHTNLLAYYKFDNSSNFGLDSGPNNLNLTTNGSPSATAGIINGGVNFPSSSTYLNIVTTSTQFEMNTDFTITAWFNTTNANTSQAYYILYDNVVNWYLGLGGSSPSQIYLYSTNTNQRAGVIYPATGTWFFICAWYDSIAQTLNIQLNNGSIVSTSLSSPPSYSSSTFIMGDTFLANLVKYDEIGIWKRVLTSTERSNLWNNGIGLQYPF